MLWWLCALFSNEWCRLQDSNPRPPDYKSGALPTELNRRSSDAWPPLNTNGAQTATPLAEKVNLALLCFILKRAGNELLNRGIDMTKNTKLVVPALIALGLFTFVPALAGNMNSDDPDANDPNSGAVVVSDPNATTDPEPNLEPDPNANINEPQTMPERTEVIDSGDDPEQEKNNNGMTGGGYNYGRGHHPDGRGRGGKGMAGGEGHGDKNGGGDGKNGEVPTPVAPTPAAPRPQLPRNYGSNSSDSYHQITCIVNGRVFQVRSRTECFYARRNGNGGYHGQAGNYDKGSYHGNGSYYGRGRYQGNGGYGGNGVYHRGGGYTYGGMIGYGSEGGVYFGSPAARMQAAKRARRNGGYGYSYGGGYAGEGGYGNGGGYSDNGNYGGNCNCGNGRAHKKHRRGHRMRFQSQDYGYNGGSQGFTYDPGVVIHYGPTIAKDGGY
jgi:hypothetical protein